MPVTNIPSNLLSYVKRMVQVWRIVVLILKNMDNVTEHVINNNKKLF